MNHSVVKKVIPVFLAALSTTCSYGVSFGFEAISNNSGVSDSVAAQLVAEVTSGSFSGDDTVDFKFLNIGAINSVITQVYWDDDANSPFLLDLVNINESAGVSFSEGASPPVLPGGDTISPPFVVSFSADADPQGGVPNNGVANTTDGSEWVEVQFTFQSGFDFQDVIDGINSGLLRMGIHGQSIGEDEESDSFVTSIPDGGTTLLLLGSGLAALALLSRRIRA